MPRILAQITLLNDDMPADFWTLYQYWSKNFSESSFSKMMLSLLRSRNTYSVRGCEKDWSGLQTMNLKSLGQIFFQDAPSMMWPEKKVLYGNSI